MFKKLIINPDFKLDDQPKCNNIQSPGQVKIKKIKKTRKWVDAGTCVKTQNFASQLNILTKIRYLLKYRYINA